MYIIYGQSEMIMKKAPFQQLQDKPLENTLKVSLLETPLGQMAAVADATILYLLEFADFPRLEQEVKRIQKQTNTIVTTGSTPIHSLLEKELNSYFKGSLTEFKTPLGIFGSPFQQQVWQELKKIPFGQTRSYLDVAMALAKPTGFRAVAKANSTNKFVIIIPCHRVINSSGELGGYGGGIPRKQWLINHERQAL
jgi:AraC family transcriptional regulator, regulatory protein of adaptative response / methylated-DNA-[protein]-cysteine methyltransferase